MKTRNIPPWKKEDTESTTYYTIPSASYTVSNNNITISNWGIAISGTEITDLLKENVYYFKIKIQDSFKTNYITLVCSKGEWLMAKFEDRVDFKGITIQGNPIVESGSNANGNYIKYYDGTLICYKRHNFGTVSCDTAWGSLYETSSALDLGNFPVAFVGDYPDFYIMPWHAFFVERKYTASLTSWGSFWVVRPNNSNVDVIVSCYAIGKWK